MTSLLRRMDWIREAEEDWFPTHVMMTGDIALRADKGGYQAAVEWLGQLFDRMEVPRANVIACVGNHDVQRDVAESVAFRNKLGIHADRPGRADEADKWLGMDVAEFQPIFSHFESFCGALGLEPLQIGATSSYLVGERYFQDVRLRVVVLNSAWFSRSSETDRGNLWIGWNHVRALLGSTYGPEGESAPTPYRTLVLMHHPREWYHGDEFSSARMIGGDRRTNPLDYIAKRADLILTGHTHAEIRDADRIAMGAFHLTGGAAGESDEHFNSFRLIRVEADGFRYRSFEFRPDQASESWEPFGQDRFLLLHAPDPTRGHGRDAWLLGLRTFPEMTFDEAAPYHEVIDWRQHFSHADGRFPSSAKWDELQSDLARLREGLQGKGRLVRLTSGPEGQPGGCLSAGFAFGHAFQGFDVHVDQDTPGRGRSVWRSDGEVAPQLNAMSVSFERSEDVSGLVGAAAILSISRSIRPAVATFERARQSQYGLKMFVDWTGGELSESAALGLANAVAARMARAIADAGIGHTDVFFAGPFALAVLIGKLLNRVGLVRILEYDGTGYLPGVVIRT